MAARQSTAPRRSVAHTEAFHDLGVAGRYARLLVVPNAAKGALRSDSLTMDEFLPLSLEKPV